MRERMEKVRSKRVSTSEESPLPSETQVHGTEASVQPAETSAGEVATAISEGSMENDSSDEQWKVFHLMPYASISGNQGTTFMHTEKELVDIRQMML